MVYYEIAILQKPLTLTYQCERNLGTGDLVTVKVRGKPQKGVVLKEVPKPDFSCLDIEEVHPLFFDPHQMDLATFMATYYVCSIGEALGVMVPFQKEAAKSSPSIVTKEVALSKEQQKAFDFISSKPISLLFGDTGSGKTEVYIHYFQKIVQQGKRVLFLMPEISLTPQMQERLRHYFGEGVVMWHSKLSKKKRQEHLQKIYSGEASIIAGPRSALFLPIEDLGLIVVDEEHDESYKSQTRPRYHARDLAIYRAKLLDIPVVLGSATPSAGSYHRYPHVRLKGTFHKGQKEYIFDSRSGLTPLILEHIQKTLQQKKQTLIFLPTRAHFKYLVCQECGEAVKCPFCDVGMSVHFDKRAMVCHYCNFTQFIPQKCPNCESEHLSANRMGTTEVVEELQTLFPQASIAKFDKDSITTHKKLIQTIQAFSKKEIDILVGTQMLGKGHDYPDVALSVIFDIDYILAMADYRAREKAGSLFLQVAGRAGRKGRGEVIVQTKNEDFFKECIDYERFLQNELQFRKNLYPPFKRMAQLGFSHKEKDVAKRAMEEVLSCLQNFPAIEIVGFGPNAIEKIAGKWRFHILIRSDSTKALLEGIYASKNELCEVDMDPVQIG